MGELSNKKIDMVLQTNETAITKSSCAHAVMEGFGGQYVIPYALKLGATDSQIGLLSSIPEFLGSLSELFSAKIAEKTKSRKSTIITLSLLQAMTLAPLFALPLITQSMLVLTLIFSAYSIFNHMIIPTWGSLVGDEIPHNARTEYMAKRHKYTLLALVISMITAGFILHFMEEISIWRGFWILFLIAIIARISSVIYFSKNIEPGQPKRIPNNQTFMQFIENIKSNNLGNYAIFKSAFMFSVMIASPFFSVYMLKNLGFSYIQYSIIILFALTVNAMTASYWGKQEKKYGTRHMMYVSAMLISIIPLLWFITGILFEKNSVIFWIIVVIEAFRGFAWGGFEITGLNYLIEITDSDSRAKMMAYSNVFFGFFYLIGGLISSWLVHILPQFNPSFNSILIVFFLSFVLRITSASIFMKRVKEVEVKNKINPTNMLLEVALMNPLRATVHLPLSTFEKIEENVSRHADRTGFQLEENLQRLDKEIDKLFSLPKNKKHKSGTIQKIGKALKKEANQISKSLNKQKKKMLQGERGDHK